MNALYEMIGGVPETLHLTVRVEPDELDGGYISECLDLPGCMSQGDTEEAALESLADAIAAVLAVQIQDQVAALAQQGQAAGHEHRLKLAVG
jgi:predicted RNase H-like HicB family nuclease